jgi:hypothetical protein
MQRNAALAAHLQLTCSSLAAARLTPSGWSCSPGKTRDGTHDVNPAYARKTEVAVSRSTLAYRPVWNPGPFLTYWCWGETARTDLHGATRCVGSSCRESQRKCHCNSVLSAGLAMRHAGWKVQESRRWLGQVSGHLGGRRDEKNTYYHINTYLLDARGGRR